MTQIRLFCTFSLCCNVIWSVLLLLPSFTPLFQMKAWFNPLSTHLTGLCHQTPIPPPPHSSYPTHRTAACRLSAPQTGDHACDGGGPEAGPVQADGRGGAARLGRRPARLRPEEEGGGQTGVSSKRFIHKTDDRRRDASLFFVWEKCQRVLSKWIPRRRVWIQPWLILSLYSWNSNLVTESDIEFKSFNSIQLNLDASIYAARFNCDWTI